MPTVMEQRVAGWAHCEDPLCDGNGQQPVELVRTTTVYSYRDSGGDLPGPEKSFEHFTFADEKDSACPVCSKPRAAATQQRPVYPTSQYAQDGLLKLIKEGMIKPMGELAQQRGGEIDELKALAAEQAAQIAELRGLVADRDKPARRTPASG